MKSIRLKSGLLVLAVAAALISSSCPAAAENLQWLAERAPFIQEFDLSKGRPSLHRLGAFGVGNGHVFALLGLGTPQNKLTNIVGPKYEKSEELQFLPVWMKLEQKKTRDNEIEEIEFTRSTLYRVPGTSIIVSEEKNDELSLTTVTYAPPLKQSILRVVTVKNLTEEPIKNLSLVVEAAKGDETAEMFQGNMLAQFLNGRRMALGFLGAEPAASPGKLALPLAAPEPESETSFVFHITIQSKDEALAPPAADPDDKFPFIEETRRTWLGWFDGALSVTSSDPRLDNLFESTLALIKTQQDANSGAISPMAKYSRTWCRDGFGPVRLLLASGKFEEVRRFLAYYDYATRLEGFRNSYRLDIDVSKAPEKVDWDSMTPQQGDDPNLLILQFYHYYKAANDKDFIKKHYGFLRRNLTGQKHADYRLPFHGDETFQVFLMMAEGSPMKDFYTADTGFEYVAAARALSEMAAAIGEEADSIDFAARAEKCREKTEEYYWNGEPGYYIPYVKKDTLKPSISPFANINLRPLWIDYAPPGDHNQRRNVFNTAKKLMNRRGTMKSHARSANYTGMVPGLLLYSLKVVGAMKRADLAYDGMMNRALSPTGEFAEAYDKKDRWINYGSAPTVLRPWESAINAEAVLYYITGIRYDHKANIVTFHPHLPPGVDSILIENLFAGRNRFTLLVGKTDEGNLDIDIRNTGDRAVTVRLVTEPAPGIEPPEETEIFECHAYRRTLRRRTRKLQPGEHLKSPGGLPQTEPHTEPQTEKK